MPLVATMSASACIMFVRTQSAWTNHTFFQNDRKTYNVLEGWKLIKYPKVGQMFPLNGNCSLENQPEA